MVSLNLLELQQVLELYEVLGLWKRLVLQYQQGPVAKPEGLAWKMQVLLDRPREDFLQSLVNQAVLAVVV